MSKPMFLHFHAISSIVISATSVHDKFGESFMICGEGGKVDTWKRPPETIRPYPFMPDHLVELKLVRREKVQGGENWHYEPVDSVKMRCERIEEVRNAGCTHPRTEHVELDPEEGIETRRCLECKASTRNNPALSQLNSIMDV